MTQHQVVSREAWRAARLKLLAKEKEMTRLNDALSAARRELPWVKVKKPYLFEGPDGRATLSDLFDGRSQLIVYHFMFAPGAEEGCPGCSFFTDQIDGPRQHLMHHDVAMALVSRAPFRDFASFKKRMGWQVPWLSSHGTDFNADFGVVFSKEQIEKGEIDYNFGTITTDKRYMSEDLPGISVFYKDPDGSIFHTYSAYARGLDVLMNSQHFLDIAPKGRNERSATGELIDWVRHHDRYDDGNAAACCA
jgi:predicted dithiol-disulfide oxidoreductase (DUF899 family)